MTRRRGFSPVAAVALACLAIGLTVAVASAGGHEEREAREIAKLLKCPICQNLSVADSPSPLATQMRDSIRRQLEAGASREEILAYFVERYGEEVLLDPPKSGFSGVVWWGAAGIGGTGLLLVAVLLRSWTRRGREPEPDAALSEADLAEYGPALERELARTEGGVPW